MGQIIHTFVNLSLPKEKMTKKSWSLKLDSWVYNYSLDHVKAWV